MAMMVIPTWPTPDRTRLLLLARVGLLAIMGALVAVSDEPTTTCPAMLGLVAVAALGSVPIELPWLARAQPAVEAALGGLIVASVGAPVEQSQTEAELLRIAQEAVTNGRRHASAENLWVTCTVAPPAAHLVVENDGHGLGAGRPDSFGLQVMRERAERLGGDLRVSDRPGGGTRVEVMVGQVQLTCEERTTSGGRNRT